MKFPIKFAGVDGVRIVKHGDEFVVQSQWERDAAGEWSLERVLWHAVGTFATVDEAIDQAPYLCEF